MKKLLLDETTGEYVEVWMIGKKLEPMDKGYVKVFITFLRDVVEDKELFGKAGRLLLYMVQRLDWNSLEVVVFPEKAMQDLKISEVTFYRWLKVLLKKGYIQKLRPNYYKLKPFAVVKGSMSKVEEVDF